MKRTRPVPLLKKPLPPAQRRKQDRSPCDLDVAVRALGAPDEAVWIARVWDLSQRGISFHLGQDVPPGTILEIQIQKRGWLPRKLLARVAHATQHAPDAWIIGCDLDHKLSDRELAALRAD